MPFNAFNLSEWRDRSILGQYEGLKSESKQAFLY